MNRPTVLRRSLDLFDGAVIKTPVSVSLPSHPRNGIRGWPPPHKIDTFAIWDTGATNTAFDRELVDKLGLTPNRPATLGTSHGPRDAHFHLADIYLFELPFLGIEVVDVKIRRQTSAVKPRPVQVLIGMDIIMKGDFALTLHRNKLELFFRVPSVGLKELACTLPNLS